MKILFACTGNTCRSPMAQAMAAKLFGDGYEVLSAGVMAMPGQKASENAIEAMKRRQIDLTGHKSQPVSESLLEWADLVLAMTAAHKSAICLADKAGKVYTLREYAGAHDQAAPNQTDISDPFGGDLGVYLACAEEIYGLLLKIKEGINI